MHIYVLDQLTKHAEAWKEFGGTPIIETVHFGLVSNLMEIYLKPKEEALVINNISYHMKIERADLFHSIIWFWE